MKLPLRKSASPLTPTLPMSALLQPCGNTGGRARSVMIHLPMTATALVSTRFARQRRHLVFAHDADAMEQNGFVRVAGDNDFRAGDAELVGDGAVDEILLFERRVKARVKKRARRRRDGGTCEQFASR